MFAILAILAYFAVVVKYFVEKNSLSYLPPGGGKGPAGPKRGCANKKDILFLFLYLYLFLFLSLFLSLFA